MLDSLGAKSDAYGRSVLTRRVHRYVVPVALSAALNNRYSIRVIRRPSIPANALTPIGFTESSRGGDRR